MSKLSKQVEKFGADKWDWHLGKDKPGCSRACKQDCSPHFHPACKHDCLPHKNNWFGLLGMVY